MPRVLVWYAIALIVLIADQLTKAWIVGAFGYGESTFITAFFNLVRAHNYGAAFSFLSDAGGWQRYGLSILSAAVSAAIAVWLARQPLDRWMESAALALILGGALGNLYDRVALGYVVDFLDFHWSGRHFPAFNVADAAISVGAVLLLVDAFIHRDGESQ